MKGKVGVLILPARRWALAGGAALISIALIIGIAAGDKPEKKYKLIGKLAKGGTQTVNYQREIEAELKVPSMPKHLPVILYENAERKITEKVQEIKGKYIIKAEREYKESWLKTDKYDKKKPRGKEDALNKKVVKMAIGKDDKIGIDADIPDDLKQSLSINENNFILFLPDKEMKIGEEWTVASSTLTAVFNFASTRKRQMHHGAMDIGLKPQFDKGEMTCKLKEVKQIDGQETAVIEMKGELSAEENELNETIIISGTGYFTLSRGKFSRLSFEGKITMRGDQPCSMNKLPVPTEGEGTLKLAIKFN